MEVVTTIDLADSLKKTFAEMAKRRLTEIDYQIASLSGERTSIEKILKKLNEPKAYTKPTEPRLFEISENNNEYNSNWTWVGKVRFILSKLGSATTTGIVEAITDVYEKDTQMERKSIVASVSAILSAKSKDTEDAIFIKTQNDRNENVYSLK